MKIYCLILGYLKQRRRIIRQVRMPVLSEVPYELSTDAHSEECKRSPQQFIPAGFPLHDQPPEGTEDSASPLTIPDVVRSGRVLLTSVKSTDKC